MCVNIEIEDNKLNLLSPPVAEDAPILLKAVAPSHCFIVSYSLA